MSKKNKEKKQQPKFGKRKKSVTEQGEGLEEFISPEPNFSNTKEKQGGDQIDKGGHRLHSIEQRPQHCLKSFMSRGELRATIAEVTEVKGGAQIKVANTIEPYANPCA